jgi:hypothetical protein
MCEHGNQTWSQSNHSRGGDPRTQAARGPDLRSRVTCRGRVVGRRRARQVEQVLDVLHAGNGLHLALEVPDLLGCLGDAAQEHHSIDGVHVDRSLRGVRWAEDLCLHLVREGHVVGGWRLSRPRMQGALGRAAHLRCRVARRPPAGPSRVARPAGHPLAHHLAPAATLARACKVRDHERSCRGGYRRQEAQRGTAPLTRLAALPR